MVRLPLPAENVRAWVCPAWTVLGTRRRNQVGTHARVNRDREITDTTDTVTEGRLPS